jgi:hypothetical protein
MYFEPILMRLCAAEISPGDVAHVVAWADGQFGIVRNDRPVGDRRWARADVPDCAKAFQNYVHLVRRRAVRFGCERAGRTAA